jgi:hypothetical protein
MKSFGTNPLDLPLPIGRFLPTLTHFLLVTTAQPGAPSDNKGRRGAAQGRSLSRRLAAGWANRVPNGGSAELQMPTASDRLSMEPHGTPAFPNEARMAQVALVEKGRKFTALIDHVHAVSVSAPLVAGGLFACAMHLDVTINGHGRTSMDELCVYGVRDRRIVSEQSRRDFAPRPRCNHAGGRANRRSAGHGLVHRLMGRVAAAGGRDRLASGATACRCIVACAVLRWLRTPLVMNTILCRLGKILAVVPAGFAVVVAATFDSVRAGEQDSHESAAAGRLQLVWTMKASLPRPGCYQALLVNGTVFVALRENQKAHLLTYDPVRDAWSAPIPLLLEKPKDGEVATLNGKIYYHGGRERDDRRSLTMEEYDPGTGRSRIVDEPERGAVRAALGPDLGGEFPSRAQTWYWGAYPVGERRFVLGSVRGSMVVDVYELRPGSDKLEHRTTMACPRIDSTVVAADGKLFFFGGWTSGSVVSDVIDSYDPDTGRWEVVGKMSRAKWNVGIVFHDGQFLLMGGKTTGWSDRDGGCIDTVEALVIRRPVAAQQPR